MSNPCLKFSDHREEKFPNIFHKTSITRIPKLDKGFNKFFKIYIITE